MAMKRKEDKENERKIVKLNLISSVSSSNYFHVALALFLLYIYLPGGESHIASLIGNGDLMPPRLNQLRVSRGPTVSPTESEDTEETSRVNILHLPSFQPKYLRRETEVYSRNPVYSRLDGGREDSQQESERVDGNTFPDDETEEPPTYLQFISARALSNIPKFFEHLKENLQALQQEDEYNNQEGDIGQPDRRGDPGGEDYGDLPSYYPGSAGFHPERSVAVKPRWKPPASGHTHNIRSFVQPPTEEETYLRRANNYNPSWLYTNLGLGKRRR